MDLQHDFPIWNKLTGQQQSILTNAAIARVAPTGTLLHSGAADCVGLFVVSSGQLRAYMLSPGGKEITLYRLFDQDLCLFSAACMMQSIQFDVMIEAEKETALWIIPADIYKSLMEQSLPIANYTNEIMASRFSEVMWLIEQILWNSFDTRLASFLLEESVLRETDVLSITHDRIAAHLGTAREVVTRMLRYFQSEGLVQLSRSCVTITGRQGLKELVRKST